MAKENDYYLKCAKMRTPDRWYFNQYVDGILAMSHGFQTKELAESFARSVEREVASMIKNGKKPRENVVQKVEKAIGWSVAGKEFDDFAAALVCKWTEYPNAPLNGIFRN